MQIKEKKVYIGKKPYYGLQFKLVQDQGKHKESGRKYDSYIIQL